MNNCRKCKDPIPFLVNIDGKIRNLCSRKYCLTCSPFGSKNTKADIDHVKNTSYENVRNFRLRKKQKAIEYKGGKCKCCGYNKCPNSLDFHHLDPLQKDFAISEKLSWGFERIKKELDKCALVCRNCHGEIHAGITKI